MNEDAGETKVERLHVKLILYQAFVTFSPSYDSNLKNKFMENTVHRSTLISNFNLLRYTFVVLPIAAGADKFMHLLTDWDKYLNPDMAQLLPFPASTFMMVVGVIEIIAGIIVLIKPRIGGYIVSAWLAAIALSLIAGGMYLDVAVRDLVIALSALSMAGLAKIAKK